jgi:hypothetical protein
MVDTVSRGVRGAGRGLADAIDELVNARLTRATRRPRDGCGTTTGPGCVSRWERAGRNPPDLHRDHDFFVVHRFVIVGRAQFDERVGLLSGPGYKVAALGLEGQRNVDEADLIHWTIGIELVREDDSWKVAGVEYTAGPTA